VSTDHLFSGDLPLVTEDQQYEPQNMYGKTKAEAEKRVLDIHPKALVVRTNFYGWGPSYRRSFSDLILYALREEKRLSLFKDVHYTPILIEIAVEAISELVRRSAYGIFNVVGDERISKYEFGQLLAREFNLPSGIIGAGFLSHQTSLVKRPFDMSISNRKICDFLGKNLGGVAEHIARLRQQEREGMTREMQAL
jgi:dTDP-4-dehydrorhamnose reductase